MLSLAKRSFQLFTSWGLINMLRFDSCAWRALGLRRSLHPSAFVEVVVTNKLIFHNFSSTFVAGRWTICAHVVFIILVKTFLRQNCLNSCFLCLFGSDVFALTNYSDWPLVISCRVEFVEFKFDISSRRAGRRSRALEARPNTLESENILTQNSTSGLGTDKTLINIDLNVREICLAADQTSCRAGGKLLS